MTEVNNLSEFLRMTTDTIKYGLYRNTSFDCTYMVFHTYCSFYRLKVYGNAALSKPISAIFFLTFVHSVSVTSQ